MNRIFAALTVSLAISAMANARTMTVKNNCDVTICIRVIPVSLMNDFSFIGNSTPDYATGFTVPDNWTSGRIWGRTDCDFDNNIDGATACVSDRYCYLLNCANTLGAPTATVAEWTLGGSADWYDVSRLIDGFSSPLEITNTANCDIASCPADLNALTRLTGTKNSDPRSSSRLCTGSHNAAETYPSSGVADYDYFKSNCPDTYAYAYDEDSGTALFTCDSSNNADYTLTFCP
ncbi:Osmotin, thaumatin-like protein [Gymnopus androsaceus JB14]|uniref:Osmotin, thaumatin-like protein n=1 Tax=Gymnopus androsaceus JB14 TaxID=1447944 RepID=A0A6A4GEP6_9AGAR|nr:Osmotin, thaumatin-like protein [Gymnopus androsaceus JB14]